MTRPLCYTVVPKRFEGLQPLVSVWIVDGKTQKKLQKSFKSQHRKNAYIYIKVSQKQTNDRMKNPE